ncbi:DUF3073 family protein [Stackebrandtia endophytica]|uniref:DUF3073 family protein n=1 Tax=Stackebrandtia endophytica TaxID=1496996 RepID=A0A543AYM2_9ACTN|nr:DUF3073 domain-containing protein [Stackebrandtia endophytica]TQL77678.1 DUF3073 family protein [Stackebrandtia endophytica]
MGRGRAKAKQTKVARRLKYHSPNTDLNALERELSGGGSADDEYDEDPYADYVAKSDVDDAEPREEDWLKKRLGVTGSPVGAGSARPTTESHTLSAPSARPHRKSSSRG